MELPKTDDKFRFKIENSQIETEQLPEHIDNFRDCIAEYFFEKDYVSREPLKLNRPSSSFTLFTTAAVQAWELDLISGSISDDFSKYYINQLVFRSVNTTDYKINSFQSFQNVATCFYTKSTNDFNSSVQEWVNFISMFLSEGQSIITTTKTKNRTQTWHKKESFEVKVYINQGNKKADSLQEVGHCSLIYLPTNNYFIDSGFGLERLYNTLNYKNFKQNIEDPSFVLKENYMNIYTLLDNLISEGVLSDTKDKVSKIRKLIISLMDLHQNDYRTMFGRLSFTNINQKNVPIVRRLIIRQILSNLINQNNQDSEFKISTTKNWEMKSPLEFAKLFENKVNFFNVMLSTKNIDFNYLESIWNETK
jgi:hypothetical protein